MKLKTRKNIDLSPINPKYNEIVSDCMYVIDGI